MSVSCEPAKQEEFHNFVKNKHSTHFRASDKAVFALTIERILGSVKIHMLYYSDTSLLTVPIAAKFGQINKPVEQQSSSLFQSANTYKPELLGLPTFAWNLKYFGSSYNQEDF